MKDGPRITEETLRALAVIADRGEATPTDVVRSSGLSKGTVSAVLRRLLDAQWLSARQESGDPSELGRPLRTFYRVTDPAAMRTALDQVRAAVATLWDALA